MSRLPVIVGFGGVNPAGRSSAHHGYRRLVIDSLSRDLADDTFASLAALMNLPEVDQDHILKQTLVRKLEKNLFDPDAIRINRSARLSGAGGEPLTFTLRHNQLPDVLPPNWKVSAPHAGQVLVTCDDNIDMLFPDHRISDCKPADQHRGSH